VRGGRSSRGPGRLASWFALHPPAEVEVVSFFITTRYAGQSDSDAYSEALIEQLATSYVFSQRGQRRMALIPVAVERRGCTRRLLTRSENSPSCGA
jgi:hypothetical protein